MRLESEFLSILRACFMKCMKMKPKICKLIVENPLILNYINKDIFKFTLY
jgi:hypothetical protein